MSPGSPSVGAFEAATEEPPSRSAVVYVVESQPYPYLDLRVDEHLDPVAELRRIYEVAKVALLSFMEALPTRKNPSGDLGEEIQGALIPD
jgi:uncharacterized Ntn-hydrolase superfamily protein